MSGNNSGLVKADNVGFDVLCHLERPAKALRRSLTASDADDNANAPSAAISL
jgi:hypothetical protein